MIRFLTRRFLAMLAVLFASTYSIYLLIAYSGDPLTQIKMAGEDNQEYLLDQATKELHLDVPPALRYFIWLRGVLGVFIGHADLGLTRGSSPVAEVIAVAVPTTIRLVLLSTILAMVIGITIGLVTALRQYSKFDYSITFISFLFYSLPIFWVAFLLKEFLAIGFNDFLANPEITLQIAGIYGLITGLIWASILGGSRKRFWLTWLIVAVASALHLYLLGPFGWFKTPSLGPIFIVLLSAAIAVSLSALLGLNLNIKSLRAALIQPLVGLIAYFVLQPLFNSKWVEWKTALLFAALIVIAVISARLLGGENRKSITAVSVVTAIATAGLLLFDRGLQSWNDYFNNEWISGRPIATIGEATTDITGSTWLLQVDGATHLLLPTMALMVISIATYVRYTRSSQLEVMNLDYIRTARAKGLTESNVVIRHAFRNALIPLTTVMALDFAGVIGGAIITEKVFGWRGMGTIFSEALVAIDLNLAMGVVLITTTSALIFNLIADLLYSVLDPRIRVR